MERAGLKTISLDDLPKYSPWTKRVLGLESFVYGARSEHNARREYDAEKFKKLLEYKQGNPDCSIKVIHDIYFGLHQKKYQSSYISLGGELFLTSPKNAYKILDDVLVKKLSAILSQSNCNTLMDLGCGYGYNLNLAARHYTQYKYIGGDFSENALALGRIFAKDSIFFAYFNFYNKSWKIFDRLKKGDRALVFTCYAIEQLPSAKIFFQMIKKYKDKISDVVHFEPVYELFDDSTLLGLMRRRYIKLNDYNCDLLSILKENGEFLKIVDLKADLIGVNALHPVCFVHWRFKDF